MSIATAITNLQGKIANAYTAIENKGGTLPATQDAQNLATAIQDIPQGEVDKRKYGATIDDVYNVYDTGPMTNPRHVYFRPMTGVTEFNATDVTDLDANGMRFMFYGKSNLKSASFPALHTIGNLTFQSTFQESGISSVSFPALKYFTSNYGHGDYAFQNAFQGCTSLLSVSFPALSSILGNYTFGDAFPGCTSLSSISFPELNIGSELALSTFRNAFAGSGVKYAEFPKLTRAPKCTFERGFRNCVSLSGISFPELVEVSQYGFYEAFNGCTALSSASFPKLGTLNSNSLRSAFEGCTSLKSVCLSALSSQSGDYSLYRAFRGCTSLTSITIPNLSTCNTSTFEGICENCNSLVSAVFSELRNSGATGLNNALKNCPELTTASFPELHTIAGNYSANHICEQCPKLTTFSMPKLSSVSGIGAMADCCNGATALANVSFPSLVRIDNNIAFQAAFKDTSVTELSFPQLSSMFSVATSGNNHVFGQNNTITKINLPKLVNISSNGSFGTRGKNLFGGCTNLVEIHFGAENQTIIEGCAGYATKWGAPNAECQIYFDL